MRQVSFREYLKGYKQQQTAIGDIARDILADDCARGCKTLRGYHSHLKSVHEASNAALRALDRAWAAYERETAH